LLEKIKMGQRWAAKMKMGDGVRTYVVVALLNRLRKRAISGRGRGDGGGRLAKLTIDWGCGWDRRSRVVFGGCGDGSKRWHSELQLVVRE
jgi:hypothetical protein